MARVTKILALLVISVIATTVRSLAQTTTATASQKETQIRSGEVLYVTDNNVVVREGQRIRPPRRGEELSRL